MSEIQKCDIPVLFEDKALLIAEKPAGMPSQPDPSGQTDLLTVLSADRPGLGLIHRLDTPTGGVMIFGKTPAAAARLSALVQDHETVRKEYLCVLSRPPETDSGDWTDLLYHDARQNKSFAVTSERKGAKRARLTYSVAARDDAGHTLVRVRLFTGRTHQIRAQFSSRGLPLVGDGRYGSREKAPGLALWAARLSLPHPITGKPVQAVSLPDKTRFPWSCFGDEAWTDIFDTKEN